MRPFLEVGLSPSVGASLSSKVSSSPFCSSYGIVGLKFCCSFSNVGLVVSRAGLVGRADAIEGRVVESWGYIVQKPS